jgi:nucleoside-diphosphate-sugar epimerase
MSKSVIVLGGSGFLGTEILRQLQKSKFSQVACGDLKPCDITGIDNIATNILDMDNLEQSCQPYDVIINCTGQVTQPMNLCLRLNSEGATNIARVSRNGKKIIQISTVAVYGTTDFADEETMPNPETAYATCKCFAEYILKTNLPQDRLTIVRLSNLFGSDQPKGLFRYLQKSYQAGNHQLDFNNDGNLSRYYLHVEDAARTIVKLVEKSNLPGILNLAGEKSYSIKELIKIVESLTKTKLEVRYAPIPPVENIIKISNAKIKAIADAGYTHNVSDYLNGLFQQKA